ncbi:angio-associated migratory cell protein isoform X2 [Rhodnius prolixus]|uniref:Angio-associated migratory cell protein n=3 Tax=Rhodnius TaxID=13248 RepID=T1IGI4_RHOPR
MGSNGEEKMHSFGLERVESDNSVLDDLEFLNVDDMVEIDVDNDTEEMIEDEDDSEASNENDAIVPEVDHSSFTFNLRKGPVYACTFHPNGEILAGGCEEETLYVWNCDDSRILLEEKFQDSVTIIKFNYDGKYLVAVDMAGNFLCWKYSNNVFTKMNSMNFNEPCWLEWHPKANVFMLAEKESFCMWRIPTFEVKYFALDSPSQVGCFMPDGKNALIGCDEGYAIILDLSSFTLKAKLKPQELDPAHSIVSLDAHPDNCLVALGTKKGRVLLFTTKNPKLVGMLEIPETDNGNYIESIKFGHECLAGLIIVAFSNYLHVYDHSKLVLRHAILLSGIGTRLVCIEPYICIGTTKAVVDVCDCRSGLKKHSLQGHTKTIMDIALSKDGKRIMTSSDDNSVKIFYLESSSHLSSKIFTFNGMSAVP